jgi:hypothetical protein
LQNGFCVSATAEGAVDVLAAWPHCQSFDSFLQKDRLMDEGNVIHGVFQPF